MYGPVQEYEYTNKVTKKKTDVKKLNIEINIYGMFLKIHHDLIQYYMQENKVNKLSSEIKEKWFLCYTNFLQANPLSH